MVLPTRNDQIQRRRNPTMIESRDILQANSIVIVGSLVFFTLSESFGVISGLLLIAANYLFLLSIVLSLEDRLPMPERLKMGKERSLGYSMWLFVVGLFLFFFVMLIMILKQVLPVLHDILF